MTKNLYYFYKITSRELKNSEEPHVEKVTLYLRGGVHIGIIFGLLVLFG